MINSNQYYISGKNDNGPVFMFFDLTYDIDGIPIYEFRPVSPGKTMKLPIPPNAVNIVFRVLVYKNHSTFKKIYEQFFWNPVKRCFVVSGAYDNVTMNFIPCTTIGDSNPDNPNPPSCCCCCACCAPSIPMPCAPSAPAICTPSVPAICTPCIPTPCCGTSYSYNMC